MKARLPSLPAPAVYVSNFFVFIVTFTVPVHLHFSKTSIAAAWIKYERGERHSTPTSIRGREHAHEVAACGADIIVNARTTEAADAVRRHSHLFPSQNSGWVHSSLFICLTVFLE